MKRGSFEILVRAVILHKGKTLLCQNKNLAFGENFVSRFAQNKKKGFYYFPGGHVDFGEKAEHALARELQEELGIIVDTFSFIGAVENVFTEDKKIHHELNLIFEAIPNIVTDQSKEDHIQFRFVDVNKLSREKILPVALKGSIIKWLKNRKIFWASQTY
ncbi:MAG: NUDIX domain-containing protein [Candidatus Portnoybacteria bacterium]|nr:NUDIX domain-containing protein [Candidatus Portnoybacteria bacterium]